MPAARLWARRDAFLKATAEGIAGIEKIEVFFLPDEPALQLRKVYKRPKADSADLITVPALQRCRRDGGQFTVSLFELAWLAYVKLFGLVSSQQSAPTQAVGALHAADASSHRVSMQQNKVAYKKSQPKITESHCKLVNRDR
jgi:hypothetical protein